MYPESLYQKSQNEQPEKSLSYIVSSAKMNAAYKKLIAKLQTRRFPLAHREELISHTPPHIP